MSAVATPKTTAIPLRDMRVVGRVVEYNRKPFKVWRRMRLEGIGGVVLIASPSDGRGGWVDEPVGLLYVNDNAEVLLIGGAVG